MAQTKTVVGMPVWVDLAANDAGAARAYYEKLFGWKVEVNPDPQYGGYGMAKVDGKDTAGIGPKQDPQQPSVWQLYIGTDDAAATAKKVEAAGGKVDVVLEMVGGTTFDASLAALAPFGRLVTFGMAGREQPTPSTEGTGG